MMDLDLLESQLAELPLYTYHFITPEQLEQAKKKGEEN